MRRTHLRSLLDTFTPATDKESTDLQRMLQLCTAEGDPFSREHFAPGHFTASTFVLSPDEQQLLLIFHGKLSLWLQPGGHIDPDDDDVVAAARREALEEVGLDGLQQVGTGIFDVDIHTIPARKSDPDHEHFDVRFLFRAPHLDAVAGSDARAARWMPLREVQTLQSDESVLRAVRKLT